jgi:hypothetical protein
MSRGPGGGSMVDPEPPGSWLARRSGRTYVSGLAPNTCRGGYSKEAFVGLGQVSVARKIARLLRRLLYVLSEDVAQGTACHAFSPNLLLAWHYTPTARWRLTFDHHVEPASLPRRNRRSMWPPGITRLPALDRRWVIVTPPRSMHVAVEKLG